MPTFNTPEPISVDLELGGAGVIRLVASDRSDTIVDVRPTNPASKADLAGAEQTRVEFSDGRLAIKSPSSGWRYYTPWSGRASIDVDIAVPAGSRCTGHVGMGTLHCEGRLAELSYKTGFGAIRAEEAGAVLLRSGQGAIRIDGAAGPAEISTGGGLVEIGRVDGAATVKNSNGDTWIGAVAGDLRVRAANGKIAIDSARSAVFAKTANGDIVLGAVASGEVVAETACGLVEVGVTDGVPAWLDLHTGYGKVRNELSGAEKPAAGEGAVEIRVRTSFGDITIRRATEQPATAQQ